MIKKSFKLIFKLKGFIETLDRLVFPDNPLDVEIITPSTHTHAGYCAREEDGKEFYVVFKHTDRKIIADFKAKKQYIGDEEYSLEESLLESAAHEVRHRVQRNTQISLLYDLIFEERSKIKDPDLRDAVEFADNLFDNMMADGYDVVREIGLAYLKKEYDACIIGRFAVLKWRREKNLSKIARVLKIGSKELSESTLSDFLFEYSFVV
jgi:hypothetical protein